ncbi:sulfocyanin [Acidianus hospitalis]|uniref:sulfocyanin n=1 Tax=Acidianus hospitalis TaxID=563177 RepID=UPI000A00C28D|nr:sulfocyanin [Acidianus hospitalis]
MVLLGLSAIILIIGGVFFGMAMSYVASTANHSPSMSSTSTSTTSSSSNSSTSTSSSSSSGYTRG